MGSKVSRRSDEEWLGLAMECRTSGMTDKNWCITHKIARSTLSKKISALRGMGYEIPGPAPAATSGSQEIVAYDISPAGHMENNAYNIDAGNKSPYPVLKVVFPGYTIEVPNGADSAVVQCVISALAKQC